MQSDFTELTFPYTQYPSFEFIRERDYLSLGVTNISSFITLLPKNEQTLIFMCLFILHSYTAKSVGKINWLPSVHFSVYFTPVHL